MSGICSQLALERSTADYQSGQSGHWNKSGRKKKWTKVDMMGHDGTVNTFQKPSVFARWSSDFDF